MAASASATKDYTVEQVSPILEKTPQHNSGFLAQTIPFYAVNVTFKNLRASHSDYVLREAALNPTNQDDRAMEWEVDLINYFRDHPLRRGAALELAREPAAVDDEDVAADVVARWGSKENGGTGYILRRAPASGGDALEDLTGAGGVALEGFSEVGGHVAGGDGVDLNAVRGPLVG